MDFQDSLLFAQQLDQRDPLSAFSNQFIIPAIDGRQQIYFLGNSLGLQPKKTAAAIKKVWTESIKNA